MHIVPIYLQSFNFHEQNYNAKIYSTRIKLIPRNSFYKSQFIKSYLASIQRNKDNRTDCYLNRSIILFEMFLKGLSVQQNYFHVSNSKTDFTVHILKLVL